MTAKTIPTADDVAGALVALREATPLVQCLTNKVVSGITADVLLAAGAAPAMVDNPYESEDFAAIASAVLVNVGTVDLATAQAMRMAAAIAHSRGTGWVLDPVAVGALGFRTELARDLLDLQPTVIRGNASEIIALAGEGAGGRGVDSTDAVDVARDAALSLSRLTGGAVAASGERDLVVMAGDADDAPDRGVWVSGGHSMMQLVIGTGCALGALVAAYTAVTADPLLAAVAGHAHTGLAGTIASQTASAPGSFAMAWRDALYTITPDDVRRQVELSPLGS